jgi:lipopolysaccharide/colanic/teichoic acid biosynthesis glycosyltransferase
LLSISRVRYWFLNNAALQQHAVIIPSDTMPSAQNRTAPQRNFITRLPANTFAITPLPPVSSGGYRLLKRMFDILVAGNILLISAPLWGPGAALCRMTGTRAMFSHSRVGKHGRTFQCYKFRTMVPDAERVLSAYLAHNIEARAEWARDQKLRNDPRVTRLGRFLRATSLDELPQLINVLKGDMTLVGPRPVVHEELERYGEALADYLSVRPGVTGLWQVSGRNDTGYEQRVALDVWYVQNRSLLVDFRILLQTLAVPFARRGAY